MADEEQLPLEPVAPVEPAVEAVEPEPAPEPTVESLQADLEEERHARKMYEDTLASLQSARGAATAASSSAPLPTGGGAADPYIQSMGITRSDVERIKAEAGLSSDEEVAAAVRWARPIMEALARPLVNVMAGLADVADRHQAQLSVEGYKELADEVEAEVQKMRARGSHLPRTELAQLARAKKLPQLLKREAAEKKAAKVDARSARAAEAIETPTAKVGPSAGGRATARSVEDVKGITSREERIKALEEMAGNRTF